MMNIPSKTNKIIPFITINIILLVGISYLFSADSIGYIFAKNVEMYVLAIIILNLIFIIKNHKDDYNIQFKARSTLIILCILLPVFIWEYSVKNHYDMAFDHDHYLDTGRHPEGEMEQEFRQRYEEYTKKHSEYSTMYYYHLGIFLFLFRFIFYIFLASVFLPLVSFVSKEKNFKKPKFISQPYITAVIWIVTISYIVYFIIS